MLEQVRFGVIGAGQISRYACQEINRHASATVVAVSDPSAERGRELAASLGGVQAYADNEAVLGHPQVDAVFVAAPNAFHAPLAKRALEHGKHVVVEKPFTTHAQEAADVVELAQRAGKLLSVAMNQRFRPEAQRVAELVRSGRLGSVYHAKAFWLRRSGIPKLGTWFGTQALAGGGALYDIGVHVLDLALYLMGRFDVVGVRGSVTTNFGQRGLGEGGWGLSERAHHGFDVDDGATALLRFSGGLTLSLDVSWALHQKEPDRFNVTLHGTEAGASVFPAELYRFGAERGVYETTTIGDSSLAYPHANRFHNFIGALLGTEQLCVLPQQALAVQRILDAIYESSKLGREVALEPLPAG
jgi:predicted dehydrogenase